MAKAEVIWDLLDQGGCCRDSVCPREIGKGRCLAKAEVSRALFAQGGCGRGSDWP